MSSWGQRLQSEQFACGAAAGASPDTLWPLRRLWTRTACPEHLGPVLEGGKVGQSRPPPRALGSVRNDYSCLDGTSGNTFVAETWMNSHGIAVETFC